jgi:hypothetical protein
MADLTNYLESALLAHTTGGSAFTQPTAWYVKLHLGDPGEDATANPAAETTRAQVTSWTGTNPRTNAAAVNWTNVSAGETVTHVSVWDAATGGNPLAKGDLAASRTLAIGDNLSIPIGDISLALD